MAEVKLKPYQIEFERAVCDDRWDTVVLSGPRSLGKTFMAARILMRCLTPGDELFHEGRESILGSATLEQARLTFSFLREWLDDGSGLYRFHDSTTRLGITHVPTNTKLRVIRGDSPRRCRRQRGSNHGDSCALKRSEGENPQCLQPFQLQHPMCQHLPDAPGVRSFVGRLIHIREG